MPLSPRERILYTDRADVWRASTRVVSGKPQDKTYAPVALGVACFFRINGSMDAPQIFGRAEQDGAGTIDEIHFDANQDIQPDDVLVLKSTDARGNNVALWGKPWAVRGLTQRLWDQGKRRAGLTAVYASQIERLPPGVTL